MKINGVASLEICVVSALLNCYIFQIVLNKIFKGRNKMQMMPFKIVLGLSFILVTFNSYAVSQQDKNKSKSCIGIESKQGKERADIFVSMDSFNSFDGGFNQKIKQIPIADKMLYSYASIGIIAVSFQTVFPLQQLAWCNEEAASTNKCNYEKQSFDGNLTSIETTWKSDSQYTMTKYSTIARTANKIKKIVVSSELPNYWNGTMTIFDEDGSKAELTWSRSADGTEHYQAHTIGGTDKSSITFTEYANCSADIAYVKNNTKITANWTLAGEKTTGKFKYCNNTGCRNGQW